MPATDDPDRRRSFLAGVLGLINLDLVSTLIIRVLTNF